MARSELEGLCGGNAAAVDWELWQFGQREEGTDLGLQSGTELPAWSSGPDAPQAARGPWGSGGSFLSLGDGGIEGRGGRGSPNSSSSGLG